LEKLEMKKTLVALAALATVGAAFAQSTVTLYGKIDWHIQNATQETAGVKTAAGNVGLQVNSAGLSGSRWGMKGSEDLGGGMKAIFDLQNGFNVDTGGAAQGGLLFGRQAYAGLSGGFGTLTAGRQYSPIDTVWGTYDGQGYTSNSAMNYAWNKGTHAEPGRIDSSLLYTTPSMGGFSAQFMYAPGENKNPVTRQSAGSYTGFLVGYANGPVGVHLGYENIKTTTGNNAAGALAGTTSTTTGVFTPSVATVAGSSSLRDWTVGASFDLGVAKLYGGYQSATQTGGNDDKGWMLGVSAPVGPVSVNFGYARETHDVTGRAFDGKSTAFGGQVVYALSKRTNVYADFLSGKTRAAAVAAGAATTKNAVYGVGMRHDF
jgi:predicted porin